VKSCSEHMMCCTSLMAALNSCDSSCGLLYVSPSVSSCFPCSCWCFGHNPTFAANPCLPRTSILARCMQACSCRCGLHHRGNEGSRRSAHASPRQIRGSDDVDGRAPMAVEGVARANGLRLAAWPQASSALSKGPVEACPWLVGEVVVARSVLPALAGILSPAMPRPERMAVDRAAAGVASRRG